MFELRRTTLTVRGQPAVVREWTAGERAKFLQMRSQDPGAAAHYMVACCLIEPAMTVEQVEAMPAPALDELLHVIMVLNAPGEGEGDGKNG